MISILSSVVFVVASVQLLYVVAVMGVRGLPVMGVRGLPKICRTVRKLPVLLSGKLPE